MTELAHDAACLKIPVDLSRLFYDTNDDYLVWLETIIDRVASTRQQAIREHGSA